MIRPSSASALALGLAAAEAPQHLVPGVRRVADAEALDGGAVEPAPARRSRARALARQRLGVELRDARHELVERLIGAARACVRAALVRHLEPQARGELLDRLGEGHVIVLHEEAEHGAVRAAAEAVIELLVRAHPERRRLLVVERAAGLELAARLLQLHARADDLHDVRAGDQLVDEVLGDAAHVPRPGKRSQPSFCLIRALTAPMSARPWAFGFTTAMTLPMSLMEAAPVAAIASAISASTSASLICAGR